MHNKHALLSASSSHRWLGCTPSARLEQKFDDHETEAAAEGTAAHALSEHKLRRALKMRSKKPVSKYDSDEMDAYTDGYVQFIMETLAQARKECPDPIVLIEQKLDFSCYVPDGFGTGDCVIVADGLLHVIDFKYGIGVLVEAYNNPQMMLYALGALKLYEHLYNIDSVAMSIYQPRRENISTWTITVPKLLAWAANTLKPRAELAFNGEGEYSPGPWCTFCRASVKCRARADEKLGLAKYEFILPPLLTDEEIEEILSRLGDLTKWAAEIAAYAQDAAINNGKQWHGFKLVESRTNRRYTDEGIVANAANTAGYNDIYKKSLIPITEMERLIHERKLDALEDLIEAANGKPVLIAYWFKHDLERIKARLRKLRITFSIPASSRSPPYPIFTRSATTRRSKNAGVLFSISVRSSSARTAFICSNASSIRSLGVSSSRIMMLSFCWDFSFALGVSNFRNDSN